MKKRNSRVFHDRITTAVEDIQSLRPSGGAEWDPLEAIKQLHIVSNGKIVPFTPNPPQLEFYRMWKKLRGEGRQQLIIILKARQLGFSTFTQALHYVHVDRHPHREAGTLSHEKEAAAVIMQMTKRFWRNQPNQRPVARLHSLRLEFAAPHNSTIHVKTANRPDAFRGFTLHHVHLSEFASYEHADQLLAAVMQCVTATGSVVIETTAKGAGGIFYEMVQAARRGESAWNLLFVPWQIEPAYQLPLDDGETLVLNQYERAYQREFGLTDSQMKWAIWKRINACNNDWNTFHEEYPASIDLAFRASGSPYFNPDVLTQQPVCDPEHIGELRWTSETEPEVGFVDDDHGSLSVWKLPEPGSRYVIGADCSEGVRQDWTIFDVLSIPAERHQPPEQCAQWANRATTSAEAGVVLYQLARWYNDALVGIERPGPGQVVIDVMRAASCPSHSFLQIGDLPFWNLYYEVIRDQMGQETRRPGWLNSSKTKTPALQDLQALLSPDGLILHCRETVQELLGFQQDPETRRYIQRHRNPITQLYNDDRVFALVIAVQMLLHTQNSPGFRRLEASD